MVIDLPDGTEFDGTAISMGQRELESLYDKSIVTFVERFANNNIRHAYSMVESRLHGPGARLSASGQLRSVAFFNRMRLDGPARVWGESGRPAAFIEYARDQKHGMSCVLRDGYPMTIIRWKFDKPEAAFSVDWEPGSDLPPIVESLDLDSKDFKGRLYMLEVIEKELRDHIVEMKRAGQKWFDAEEKAYETALAAQRSAAVREQLSRQRDASRRSFMNDLARDFRQSIRAMTPHY